MFSVDSKAAFGSTCHQIFSTFTSPSVPLNWIPTSPIFTQETSSLATSSEEAFKAHSQTTAQYHPDTANAFSAAASLTWLLRNLVSQKSVRVFGRRNKGQDSWRCQKQPWTKTTERHFGRMRSGRPGSVLPCSRYRRPACQRSFRTRTSGPVFLLRIRDINAERLSALIKSTTSAESRSCPQQ